MAARGAELPVFFLGQFGQFLITLAQTPVLFALARHTKAFLAKRAFGLVTLHAHLWDEGAAVLVWTIYWIG